MTPLSAEEILMQQLLDFAQAGRPVSIAWFEEEQSFQLGVRNPEGGRTRLQGQSVHDLLEQIEFMEEANNEISGIQTSNTGG